MSNWLTNQLTSAKQDSGMWAGLADILQSVVTSHVDPMLDRVRNRKSIFTMNAEDLDTRVAELGSFFTIRSSDASSVPMLLLQRLDEIHFKGSLRPITQTFYREFNGIPITWQPLYAPVDIATYPYGTVLISEETLDSIGDNYGEMFLTSRGVASIALNDLGMLIEKDTTGTLTQESVTNEALEKFKQVVKPLLPLHIVFDGMLLYVSVETPRSFKATMRLISVGVEAGTYPVEAHQDAITSVSQQMSHVTEAQKGGDFEFWPRFDDQLLDVDVDPDNDY